MWLRGTRLKPGALLSSVICRRMPAFQALDVEPQERGNFCCSFPGSANTIHDTPKRSATMPKAARRSLGHGHLHLAALAQSSENNRFASPSSRAVRAARIPGSSASRACCRRRPSLRVADRKEQCITFLLRGRVCGGSGFSLKRISISTLAPSSPCRTRAASFAAGRRRTGRVGLAWLSLFPVTMVFSWRDRPRNRLRPSCPCRRRGAAPWR